MPKQHAQPWRAPLRASGVHPSSELARTPEKNATNPDPFCNPRSEMHARTETREKASEVMRPSRSKRGGYQNALDYVIIHPPGASLFP